MAYKNYSELSMSDKEREDSIQKMIVTQNCLGHAVKIVTFPEPTERDNRHNITERVKEVAKELVDFVYNNGNSNHNKKQEEILPLPTPTQEKCMQKLVSHLKIPLEEVKKKAIEKIGKYPITIEESRELYKRMTAR